MRPFRFAIHLREMGWEPFVLTIGAANQHLTEKEAWLLQGVRVFELSSPLDRTARSESQLGVAQKKSTRFSRLIRELDRQFPVDTWLLLFLLRYREMLRIVREVQPDVIWTTGDPWSALVITQRIAARLRIPWAADFRDPWTLSELPHHSGRPIAGPIDRFYERRVLESADMVIFQTRSVEKAYHEHYADIAFRSRTITNSFDEMLFDDPPAVEFNAHAVSSGNDLTVAFFGRFREASPATVLIDALAELRKKDPRAAERVKIHSFGVLNPGDSEYARHHGVLGSFVQEDVVPLERALAVLRRFDILVVSTDPRREKIIPAKLFEYLPAGRPILSLSRNQEVEDILRSTGTGIQMDPRDPATIAELLQACARARDEGRPLPLNFDPDVEEIARFDARRTTEQLAAAFTLLAEARKKPR